MSIQDIAQTEYCGVYALYDLFPRPEVVGGQRRAAEAVRDRLGRFMPQGQDARQNWTLDPFHGRPGGKARAQNARRDGRGRFQ